MFQLFKKLNSRYLIIPIVLFGVPLFLFISSIQKTSVKPNYKVLIGARYEIIGEVNAHGWRDFPKKNLISISLIPGGFGVQNRTVAFRKPVKLGSIFQIKRVEKAYDLFWPYYVIAGELTGSGLPPDIEVDLTTLWEENVGVGAELNPKIYRRLQ